MKALHLSVALIILMSTQLFAQGERLTVNGVYQGKDLYVKNPFSTDGVGFCVYEVQVNGLITRDEINSSAFAIDFNILGIEKGQNVEVVISHKKGCAPLLLNPESLKPVSSFEVVSIKVERNILTWTTEGELGALPYILEQFRWNKWVKVGELMGNGTKGKHTYQFEVTPNSGENKVRVRQTDHTGKSRYSETVVFDAKIPPVTFEPKRPESTINFSAPTRFEVYDKFGMLVKTGYGRVVDVSGLNKGEEYYINYDNSFGETFRLR